MCINVGILYLCSILLIIARIHFSLSLCASRFGTWIEAIIILKLPTGVFMIAIVDCIFSKFMSVAAGYSVVLLLAHIRVPAPNGV